MRCSSQRRRPPTTGARIGTTTVRATTMLDARERALTAKQVAPASPVYSLRRAGRRRPLPHRPDGHRGARRRLERQRARVAADRRGSRARAPTRARSDAHGAHHDRPPRGSALKRRTGASAIREAAPAFSAGADSNFSREGREAADGHEASSTIRFDRCVAGPASRVREWKSPLTASATDDVRAEGTGIFDVSPIERARAMSVVRVGFAPSLRNSATVSYPTAMPTRGASTRPRR